MSPNEAIRLARHLVRRASKGDRDATWLLVDVLPYTGITERFVGAGAWGDGELMAEELTLALQGRYGLVHPGGLYRPWTRGDTIDDDQLASRNLSLTIERVVDFLHAEST